ncbi:MULTISPECIES: FIST signal transduction protein [unclassified Uliginosibacterium]|uniref:FIST signal transduction protein n=1 Tax=unclassified Uliginosibacterium TaxID=2621521 RepID=UPI00130458D3|nr:MULTISPECIES: FIST C-terminal domain-containing protein [unclassified Uliginosibacterium]MDO6387482.1 FIST C-terminal domain-containing protein [Uliginosibacterium sp. 31-12]
MFVEPLGLLGDADVALAQAQISDLLAAGARSLLILAGEASGLEQAAWDELLQRQVVPVFGGIFPRIVFGGRDHARGVLIVGLRCAAEVCIVEGLNDEHPGFARYHAHCASLREAGSVMLWVDALARHIDVLIEAAYDMVGAGPAFIGGGAGSLSLRPQPCLFSNRGLLQGAALIVGLDARVAVGVKHGWESVAGPFLVSTVRGNEIRNLDFRPALHVYRDEIARLSGLQLDRDNFPAVARSFPLGVERMDGSFLVREPVRLEGERLICIGDVPERSTLHILHGVEEALVQASGQACREAMRRSGKTPAGVLLVDCISRALYLDHAHAAQLRLLEKVLEEGGSAGIPVFGVLSLGEIANPGGGCLEFHNKTFILGLLPDACA